jgi:hypothetical protein
MTFINMTEKQIERVKIKIEKYKKALAADKRYWGGQYRDGQGIRYIIPGQYIKIGDYKSGLRYFNWFAKTFPEDSGHPIFLFEWTLVLFQNNKLQDAEKKAHLTFFANTYLFDKFLGNEPLQLDKNESSNWDFESLVQYFHYSRKNLEFAAFADWLEGVLQSREFLDKANEFIELERQLKNEPVGIRRTHIVNRISKIKYG